MFSLNLSIRWCCHGVHEGGWEDRIEKYIFLTVFQKMFKKKYGPTEERGGGCWQIHPLTPLTYLRHWCEGFQGVSSIRPPNTERRQPLGQLYVWTELFFQSFSVFFCVSVLLPVLFPVFFFGVLFPVFFFGVLFPVFFFDVLFPVPFQFFSSVHFSILFPVEKEHFQVFFSSPGGNHPGG